MTNLEQTLHDRILRARSAVGHGIVYKLGEGGKHPDHPLPTDDGECDCSGFVAWVLHLNRAPKRSRHWWIETTEVHKDATIKGTTFKRIPKPVPGCIVVYPDHDGHQGHIAIVSSVDSELRYSIIDCSVHGKGITEHLGTAFMGNLHTVFCHLKQDLPEVPVE